MGRLEFDCSRMPFLEIRPGNRESVVETVLTETSDILLEDSEGPEGCNAALKQDECDDFDVGSFFVHAIFSHASKFFFVKRRSFVGLSARVPTDSSDLRFRGRDA